jgi:SAM-dependent methyltransferase
VARAGERNEVIPASGSEGTARFYDTYAERYAAQTQLADLAPLRARLANASRAGGALLDVGCGGGRDLRAFRLMGFRAVGLEPSEPLARIARAYSGCEVQVGKVEDMDALCEFDAIWACASLLHLPKTSLQTALTRIHDASKSAAVFFLSMQLGVGEFVAPDGRYYALYQPDELSLALRAAGFDVVDVWESGDSLGERPIRWINLLSRA